MSDKLKIKGMGSLELVGGEPEQGKEYLLSMVVERDAKRIDEKDPDEPITIYEMSYLRTEALQEIGSTKKLKVTRGKTQSQKLRFTMRDVAAFLGVDEDEYYNQEMAKIIDHYRDKIK